VFGTLFAAKNSLIFQAIFCVGFDWKRIVGGLEGAAFASGAA
jgi:hypothetical protein